MELTVSHRITTRFAPVRRRLVQSHRLFPSDCASQSVQDWRVSVSEGIVGAEFRNGAGDRTQLISTGGDVAEHTIEVTGVVQTFDTLGVLRDLKEKVPPLAYLSGTRLTRPDAGITALAKQAIAGISADQALDRTHALASAVTQEMTQSQDAEDATLLSAADAFEVATGRDVDFAHVLISAAHAAGIPARFVYGYAADGTIEMQSKPDDDAPPSALIISAWPGAAWAELWVPGMGWVGFDTLRECCPDEGYIRLCSGRDAQDAAPLRATALGQSSEVFEVSLDVRSSAQ